MSALIPGHTASGTAVPVDRIRDPLGGGYSERFRRIHLWIIMATIPLGLGFGFVGFLFYQRDHGHPLDVLSAGYHTLQLFVLHLPHLPGSVNGALELGRWLAAVASGSFALLLLHFLLWGEWRRFCLRHFRKHHVVVCGLGKAGVPLVLEFQRAGRSGGGRRGRRSVVAIEGDPRNPNIVEIERRGIVVVQGDARERSVLKEARAHMADQIVAVCSDENTNVAITTTAGYLVDERPSSYAPLHCYFTVSDHRLRAQLVAHGTFPNQGERYIVKVGGVDLAEFHARHALAQYPPDFGGIAPSSPMCVHIIVVGCGALGKALGVKALQIGHFANASRLRLTFVGPGADTCWQELRSRHVDTDTRNPHWYDGNPIQLDWEDPTLVNRIVGCVQSNELVTVAFCTESPTDPLSAWDGWNLAMALTVKDAFQKASVPPPGSTTGAAFPGQLDDVQLLVCLNTRTGFSKLLVPDPEAPKAGQTVPPVIHPIGLADDALNIETLLREDQDLLAKGLHADFFRRYGGDTWENLDEVFRESNRQAADHIPVKIRAIGCRIMPIKQARNEKRDLVNTFSKAELDIMSEMEHERWCAERWLFGWKYGIPVDQKEKLEKKINKNLLPWEDLPQDEREKDPEQIRAIPGVLEKVGLCIVRDA